MDFEFTEEEKRFQKEVDDFVRERLPADWDEQALYWPGAYGAAAAAKAEFKEFHKQLNRKMGERGWLSLGWPKEYYGQNSMVKQAIVDDVTSYYRAPVGGVATLIGGPTIIAVGSDEMKREWLPKIASGEVSFWLAYSEPNAGSDLGSLKTSAVEDGDEFVINGQKIWSTGAHTADYVWMLARTDPKAPKHKGATLLLIDNKTPGITINPIINICGIHSFNEVFFDDVRVPRKNIVGELNRGFYNVMLALQYERLLVGSGAFRRILEELVEYVKETESNNRPLSKDPAIRNKLAEMAVEIDMLYCHYWQTAWKMDRGQFPDRDASVLKLIATELSRTLANVAMDILGLYCTLERGSKWAPLKGRVSLGYLDSISGPIGAGTSEIQRSIIATRGLGLPRR